MNEELQQLRGEAATWNLASDHKLLTFLRKFSLNIAEKTNVLKNKVEDLTSEVSQAEVGLRNTFNEFLMLANTQFIENVISFPHLKNYTKLKVLNDINF